MSTNSSLERRLSQVEARAADVPTPGGHPLDGMTLEQFQQLAPDERRRLERKALNYPRLTAAEHRDLWREAEALRRLPPGELERLQLEELGPPLLDEEERPS